MSAVQQAASNLLSGAILAALQPGGSSVLPVVAKKRGRPAKGTINPLKPYLSTFTAPGHALAKIPYFDNIITGAVNIDMGRNTRPLSKKVVIRLLQELDVISTKGILDYMELTLRPCGVRHAQKVAEILCIIIRACSGLLGDDWLNDNGIDDTSLYCSAPIIEPCGNSRCIVCTSHAACLEAEGDCFAVDFETEGYLN